MAQFIKHFVQDLQQDIKIRQCGTIVFNKDNLSNVISVDLYNGQEEYSGGGSVTGAVIRPDGSTVPITNGTISGKTVSITLIENCFIQTGQIGVGIQVVNGTTKTTVLKANYNVELFETDTVVDPGGEITASVGQLVQDIEQATAEIPASDMASLMSGIAPQFKTTTNYAAGAYAYYNGTLYQFTTSHAAGSWTGTDVTPAIIGNSASELKHILDAFCVQELSIALTFNAASSIDPETGINAKTGCRSGYNSYNRPIIIKSNLPEYKITVWTYAANSTSSYMYSPTGSDYVDGVTSVFIKPISGSNPNFRIGVVKKSGGSITAEERDAIAQNISFYTLTDESLAKSGYPADAKATGDAISELSSTVSGQISELSSTVSGQITGLSNRIDQNKNQLVNYNAINLFDFYKPNSGTSSDVTLTTNNDGTITIDGIASGSTFFNIINSSTAIPEYIIPGRSYKLSYDGGIIPVRVYFYYTTGTNTHTDYSGDAIIDIPAENLRGTIIRYQISSGMTFDNMTTRVSLIAVQDGAGGSGATINNTYNITTSPQITTDTNGWLQAVDTDTSDETGKTDMTGAIMSMLTETGYCHLSPGIFYVSGNIDMPNGSTLEGCGESTVIRLLQSVESGYIVKPFALCQIKSLRLSGRYSAITSFDPSIGTRHGINFEGEYDISEKYTTHCMVDNVWIENFTGAGIRCYRSSINYARGLYVSQAYINRCHTGIYIEISEFNKFSNVCIARCYNGCVNNGGNNVFSACTFHASHAGFVMDGTIGNNGHGTVTGCTFCHIGNNVGVAIDASSVTQGFVFSNCQIWYNSVNVLNSAGVLFSNNEFGRGTGSGGATINVNGGGTVMFSGCMFMNDITYPPDITISNNSNVKFVNCYGSESGNAITGN